MLAALISILATLLIFHLQGCGDDCGIEDSISSCDAVVISPGCDLSSSKSSAIQNCCENMMKHGKCIKDKGCCDYIQDNGTTIKDLMDSMYTDEHSEPPCGWVNACR